MSASESAALVVSVVSVSVAVAAYISARHDPRLRIRGSINAVLHAPLLGCRQAAGLIVIDGDLLDRPELFDDPDRIVLVIRGERWSRTVLFSGMDVATLGGSSRRT